jgi:hypothetical protein
MSRCPHGVFLPESPKYTAGDVCSLCREHLCSSHEVQSLSDTIELESEEPLETLDVSEFISQPFGARLAGKEIRQSLREFENESE